LHYGLHARAARANSGSFLPTKFVSADLNATVVSTHSDGVSPALASPPTSGNPHTVAHHRRTWLTQRLGATSTQRSADTCGRFRIRILELRLKECDCGPQRSRLSRPGTFRPGLPHDPYSNANLDQVQIDTNQQRAAVRRLGIKRSFFELAQCGACAVWPILKLLKKRRSEHDYKESFGRYRRSFSADCACINVDRR
jgi:hypothetical protein